MTGEKTGLGVPVTASPLPLSVVGGAGNSLVLSEHESIKEAESLNNNKVTFTMVVPMDEDDQGEMTNLSLIARV